MSSGTRPRRSGTTSPSKKCPPPGRMARSVSMPPLRERLLAVMDRKHHWAYPALTRPGLTREQLGVHFRHEFLVYVRDFPALLARTLAQTPPLEPVRAVLAANLYEE